MRLSWREKAALSMMFRWAQLHPDAWSAVSAEATSRVDGQPWIHGNTIRSLERKGLVEVEWDPEGSSCRLTAAGVKEAPIAA